MCFSSYFLLIFRAQSKRCSDDRQRVRERESERARRNYFVLFPFISIWNTERSNVKCIKRCTHIHILFDDDSFLSYLFAFQRTQYEILFVLWFISALTSSQTRTQWLNFGMLIFVRFRIEIRNIFFIRWRRWRKTKKRLKRSERGAMTRNDKTQMKSCRLFSIDGIVDFGLNWKRKEELPTSLGAQPNTHTHWTEHEEQENEKSNKGTHYWILKRRNKAKPNRKGRMKKQNKNKHEEFIQISVCLAAFRLDRFISRSSAHDMRARCQLPP